MRFLNICLCTLAVGINAEYDASKFWDNIGGLQKVVSVIDKTVERHETDPLTRDWFGPGKFHNAGTHDAVVNSVLTFFCAGFAPEEIKAKYEYKGRSMVEAHKGMKLTENAFHALAGHLITEMKLQNAGGPEDREFILGVLKSVWQTDIQPNTNKPANTTDFIEFTATGPYWSTPTTPENLWDRLGGLTKIAPLIEKVVTRHETDPLTKDWFGPGKFHNAGTHDAVVNSVLTFFASAFAPEDLKEQLKYTGKSMAERHKGMKLTDVAFHALAGHLLTELKEQRIAGPVERDFILGVLKSVWEGEIKPHTNEPNDDADFKPYDAVNAKEL